VIRVVGLGPGDPDAVPVSALSALRDASLVLAPGLETALADFVGVVPGSWTEGDALPDAAVIVAPDAEAYRIALRHPEWEALPALKVLRGRAIGAEVAYLAEVGLRLRRDCPWDREQTAETIVPHTVEEAFEVAEAVASGDPAKQLDELGDLLFQTVFLAQLLEEPGEGNLASVARGQADKLISRHPHVYGDAVAKDAERVLDMWDKRKRDERSDEGIFHEVPPGLPALAYGVKTQKRAAAVGFDFTTAEEALAQLDEEVAELREAQSGDELGDVVFACVAVARRLGVDLELAARSAAQRFRTRVEQAAALAAAAGEDFEKLNTTTQTAWYEKAKRNTPAPGT
jgi:MazG family protein